MSIIRDIQQITDGGRKNIVVAGDFNMQPKEMEETGITAAMGLDIIHTPYANGTCRLPTGSADRILDYVLCTKSLTPIIGECKIHHDVPWWPHYGISFAINKRAT